LPPASSTAVAAIARAVDRVALDKESVLLRGLIEIAQRRMHYTFITDEKGTAIKVRRAGRREMALLVGFRAKEATPAYELARQGCSSIAMTT
jgi:hypothetical protein